MHESYRNSMQIHNEGVEEGGSNMENKGHVGSAYNMLNIEGNKDQSKYRISTQKLIIMNVWSFLIHYQFSYCYVCFRCFAD